ncbi:hypothetical protein DAEQUDRAFT_733083 [Daedalea quercina L-15889]|uniref:GIY-YIG domain-containing protein n=1 Tax=Daedalea quercina L-15889 TaxID=1314783 RepID=A0A165L994_9APHY|nr:hypothetical protein DAEQUDRAFT_733083 [Daedalea quercina L-15889]
MPRKVNSSLVDHHFPRFYACYLLKSIRTPRATATYIGSTPSPPRRIRQHNGEITQGAWKTKHNRPWVMQMIVHGFPSRLTALQFEWAWQHPHLSRHLRSENGKAVFHMNSKSRYLSRNVSIARSMICSHPYNTWPLRVKLFTTEAEKAWNDASRDCIDAPLPRGFTCTTELEGVDGKSGKVGTGRIGAIDVSDSAFTSEHLSKWTTLLASAKQLQCTVCEETLSRQHLDPLNIAFCPTSNCTATSHLACLSSDFLQHERTANTTSGTGMIPRGGECRSCRTYVLWGDIIRGCYRRRGEDAPDMESDHDEDLSGEESQSCEDADDVPPSPRRRSRKTLGKKSTKPHGAATQKKRSAILAQENSSEGEFFDLNNVSGDSEEDALDERPLRATSRRGTTSADDPAPVRPVGRSTVLDKGHLTKATQDPDFVRDRREDSPLRSHAAGKAPHRIGAAKRRRKAANAAEDAPSSQANAPTSVLDEGLTPLGSHRRQVPYLKTVPSYVESDSAESSSCEPDNARQPALPSYSQSRRGSKASAAQPEGSLSEADGFGSPGHLGSPPRRLSCALSTLSISSGSELPDMVHILRDLEKKKQDGGDHAVVVSD